ncbi:hypothetical protein NXS19_004947 [Fusarium pseudograminearum]|nr:hypothetical protein NXS19_004947 [Fusarium pseudograminearum]
MRLMISHSILLPSRHSFASSSIPVPSLVEDDALADWKAWDESLGWVMEDPNPVMDQPPTETPPTETPPAEAPTSPKPTIPELKATIDARVRAREHLMGSLYAHLPARRLTGRWRGRLCVMLWVSAVVA